MIVLHTLGRCAIQTDAGVITPRAPVVFALGLKLLMHPGRRVTRSTMLSTFWPEEEDEGIRRRLLRKNLCEARTRGLLIHGAHTEELWVSPDEVRTDIDYLATESVETLLTRDYTVLAGYTPDPAWQTFHDQVDDFRERMRRRVIAGLTTALECHKADGEWGMVQQLAALLLVLDESHMRANELHARATRILRKRRIPETAMRAYEPQECAAGFRTTPIRIVKVGRTSHHYPASRDTPLRGRKDDLALLTSSFLDAVHARETAVYLHGPAGIGKSRLVREFTEIAKADGAEIVQVTCEPEHVNQPLAPFVSLAPQLLRLATSPSQTSPWIECLDTLLRPSDTDFSYASSVRMEILGAQDRLQHAIGDLMDAAAADRPLVVIVENTHWCHHASWSILNRLLRSEDGQERERLFVFTTREPWHEDVFGPPQQRLRIHHIQQLDSTASEQHIREYIATIEHTADEKLIKWWVEVGEGNPYFHEELVNHWAATGESFRAPPSLTTVVNARLARLTPQALHVLQTCAALGEHASFDRLLRLFGDSRHKFLATIDELGRAGMLALERDATFVEQRRVACRHDVLGAQALHHLSEPAKALLHTGIGKTLEEDLNDSPSAALLWSCADHWHRAGDTTRAIVLGLSCASHLSKLNLTAEAVTACRKTLKYCSDDDSRYRVLRTLAYTLYQRGEWDDIFFVLAGARRLQHQIVPHEGEHNDLELLALNAAWHAERYWQPILDTTMRCVAADEAEPNHRVQAGVIALKMATNLGDMQTIHQVYQLTRGLCSDPATGDVDRLTIEMIYHAICGNPHECFGATQALVSHSRQMASETESLQVRLNCAGAFLRAGFKDIGIQLLLEIFERSIELKAPMLSVAAAHRLSSFYLENGDVDSAETWIDRYDQVATTHAGRPLDRRIFRLNRARVAICRGLYPEADQLLEDGSSALWDDPVVVCRAGALAMKIRVDIANNRAPEHVGVFVQQLTTEHNKLCEMGFQDFETSSLYLGLRYIGANFAAREKLFEYTRRRRHASIRPSLELLDFVAYEASHRSGLDGEAQLRDFLSMWQ